MPSRGVFRLVKARAGHVHTVVAGLVAGAVRAADQLFQGCETFPDLEEFPEHESKYTSVVDCRGAGRKKEKEWVLPLIVRDNILLGIRSILNAATATGSRTGQQSIFTRQLHLFA